jgi:hypothetical protein
MAGETLLIPKYHFHTQQFYHNLKRKEQAIGNKSCKTAFPLSYQAFRLRLESNQQLLFPNNEVTLIYGTYSFSIYRTEIGE